ncbi:MAG: NAD-dependent deacylase [Desulfovibrio sp.]|jgi:NAD-dependent deacetylase|nr:NAD-dependent deacylase [Desulfovibrio sp.]
MIVILTGAGISRESGLPTFRGVDGLWEKARIEEVATSSALRRDPARVYRFCNAMRAAILSPGVAPNPAHYALARLQAEAAGEVVLVTQNIDDLHERAGSEEVLHMHGEGLKARCRRCGFVLCWEKDLFGSEDCPECKARKALRPHIVLFDEEPLYMGEIRRALDLCGLFVSIGTSGSVYPAAGFVSLVRARGVRTLELNLEPSLNRGAFSEAFYGPASEIVPKFVNRVLSGKHAPNSGKV